MEKTLLKSQETTYDDYIAYLWKMSDEFRQHLSLANQKLLFSKTSKIKTIPEITRPVARVFTTCQFSKYDVAKLLVRVNVSNAELKVRKIQPMELYSNYIHEIYRETVGAKEWEIRRETNTLSVFLCHQGKTVQSTRCWKRIACISRQIMQTLGQWW